MATKTKRTNGGKKSATDRRPAVRLRGGDTDAANETVRATTKTRSKRKAGDQVSDTDKSVAGLPVASVAHNGTGEASAGHKSNGRSADGLKPIDIANDREAGDQQHETEARLASHESNGHATARAKPISELRGRAAGEGDTARETDASPASTCRTLQSLQRRRAAAIKSRIAIDNQLTAVVAVEIGYSAGMTEEERKARWKQAAELIKSINDGGDGERSPELTAVRDRVSPIVASTQLARAGFDAYIKALEKEMVASAGSLPVAKWAESVRGFGLLRLAVVIGETGDLSLYANPGKVWKRLGMAPFNGKMPSTWRSGKEGKLSAEEWTAIGYSPRRRSIMYVVSELLVKLNDGAYRARYDEAKARVQPRVESEEWTKGRAHAHAMLLCAKRLVRDLWIEWKKQG